ncbi:hypothetical protein JW935_13210 [candidate division KSB1 bacterium]|nr:hypothetical protein [candidate division KSB1 bacterium]
MTMEDGCGGFSGAAISNRRLKLRGYKPRHPEATPDLRTAFRCRRHPMFIEKICLSDIRPRRGRTISLGTGRFYTHANPLGLKCAVTNRTARKQ